MSLEDLVLCPISAEPMLDAVNAPSGRTYSEAAIKREIQLRHVDPFTKKPLKETDLVPNYPIRQAAAEYNRQQQAPSRRHADPSPEYNRQRNEVTPEKRLEVLLLQSYKSDELVLKIDKIRKIDVSDRLENRFSRAKKQVGGEILSNQLHGTLEKNVDGICASGFTIPKSFGREDNNEGNLRFGKAIYTTPTMTKATSYGDGIVFVCDVVCGKVWSRDETYEGLEPATVHQKGYSSIHCNFNGKEDSERAFYVPDQVIPRYVVEYSTQSIEDVERPRERLGPRCSIKSLLQYLHFSTRERHDALRIIGDRFRDAMASTLREVAPLRPQYYALMAKFLRGSEEQLHLHVLRCLWNSTYNNRLAQAEVLEFLDPVLVTGFLSSYSESVMHRAAGVLVNLCHLETSNHRKVLSALRKPGAVFVNGALSGLRRRNYDLCEKMLTTVSNIISSGVPPFLSPVELDSIVEQVMFAGIPHEGCQNAANILCSNTIFRGSPDVDWLQEGYKPRSGAQAQ